MLGKMLYEKFLSCNRQPARIYSSVMGHVQANMDKESNQKCRGERIKAIINQFIGSLNFVFLSIKNPPLDI